MADTTLTAVPTAIYAGDSLSMLIGLSDYSAADGWELSYHFRKVGGTEINITSTASGANHLFNVTADTTADWTDGEYKGVGKVTSGSTVVTIWTGSLTIKPDLADAAANFDTRSSAKKCLDAINTVLEGKATRDVMQVTIAGQSIGRMTFSELLAAQAHFQDLVDREQQAIDAANGLGGKRNVLIRFGNA